MDMGEDGLRFGHDSQIPEKKQDGPLHDVYQILSGSLYRIEAFPILPNRPALLSFDALYASSGEADEAEAALRGIGLRPTRDNRSIRFTENFDPAEVYDLADQSKKFKNLVSSGG